MSYQEGRPPEKYGGKFIDNIKSGGSEWPFVDTGPEPPNYYLLPNGLQVKEVARYLTSNAGQAVQYIARSSRIDGVLKGEPVRDLEKARDMIDDEINRLKEKE